MKTKPKAKSVVSKKEKLIHLSEAFYKHHINDYNYDPEIHNNLLKNANTLKKQILEKIDEIAIELALFEQVTIIEVRDTIHLIKPTNVYFDL